MGRYLVLDQFHDLAFDQLVAPGMSITGSYNGLSVYYKCSFPPREQNISIDINYAN